MSEELVQLSTQILLEIETMQNHLNLAKRLAIELQDTQVLAELDIAQIDLNVARETLMQKIRESGKGNEEPAC